MCNPLIAYYTKRSVNDACNQPQVDLIENPGKGLRLCKPHPSWIDPGHPLLLGEGIRKYIYKRKEGVMFEKITQLIKELFASFFTVWSSPVQ